MSLQGSVVVITGASSGIGRAAAHAFAERGARLVLAARREGALAEARDDCRGRGAQAIAVPTDVGDERQVTALKDAAVEAFGGIDVWVGNAGVSLFGRIEETPARDFERVIRTNLLGVVHAARAVVPLFRRRGRGHLVIVSSVVSHVGQPFTSAYCASKFALRGLAECLRQELVDVPGVHVSTLLPASIDTEIFRHAGNYTGRSVQPLEPIYPPEMVARDLVRLVETPQRELVSGSAGQLLVLGHRLAPGLTERAIGGQTRRRHFRDGPAPRSGGNIHEPTSRLGAVSDGWRESRSPSLCTAGLGLLALTAFAGVSLARAVFGLSRRR